MYNPQMYYLPQAGRICDGKNSMCVKKGFYAKGKKICRICDGKKINVRQKRILRKGRDKTYAESVTAKKFKG